MNKEEIEQMVLKKLYELWFLENDEDFFYLKTRNITE